MDFKNAKELLALCQEKKLPISEVMRQREILLGETTAEIVDQRMDRVLEIMKDAAFSPIKDPVISMGGLIGGEARKLCEFHDLGKSLCGNVLGKGITYAMATLETNASMGLIVASPTAGSAGIVPGMMLALQEVYGFSDKKSARHYLMQARSAILPCVMQQLPVRLADVRLRSESLLQWLLLLLWNFLAVHLFSVLMLLPRFL